MYYSLIFDVSIIIFCHFLSKETVAPHVASYPALIRLFLTKLLDFNVLGTPVSLWSKGEKTLLEVYEIRSGLNDPQMHMIMFYYD